MRSRNIFILTVLILSLVLSSCASAAPAPAKEQDMQTDNAAESDDAQDMQEPDSDNHSADMIDDEDMKDEADMSEEMADKGEGSSEDAMEMSTPDWFDVSLTDIQTGQSFTINELKGKVVLVETLAMWCSNCLKQQKEVLSLHEQLGERDDFISLGFDIDPNEEEAGLKSYVEKNGFYWPYVITGADLARDLGNLYGNQYLNPPSTPMLIIDRSGEVHLLPFGIKSADTLQEALQPYLDQAM